MRHAWFLVLAACGGAPPPPPATVPTADPAAKVQRVNSILSLSTACWLGRDEGKCKELIVLADGKENPEELAPLRAIDGNVTRELSGKMATFAHQDGMDDVKTAQKLFAAIVDAEREAAVARKAAEGIKADPEADKVATGETVAAKDSQAHVRARSALRARCGRLHEGRESDSRSSRRSIACAPPASSRST